MKKRKWESKIRRELNASKALEICHRGYMFKIGAIALEGNRDSLIKDGQVEKILVAR